uniref:Secreted protein n=1 Tax=Suricata suricatta TaxID=37032 RepID=A0A673UR89_SURSU
MCTCSALFWLNAFSQSVQWNARARGRSPVWMRLWRSSWLGLANAFSQASHLNTRGFWELREGPAWCVCMCSLARLKAFLHTGHTWMRSRPCTSLLCCSSMAADAKLRPHSTHWCSRASFSGGPPWARLVDTSVTCSGSETPNLTPWLPLAAQRRTHRLPQAHPDMSPVTPGEAGGDPGIASDPCPQSRGQRAQRQVRIQLPPACTGVLAGSLTTPSLPPLAHSDWERPHPSGCRWVMR